MLSVINPDLLWLALGFILSMAGMLATYREWDEPILRNTAPGRAAEQRDELAPFHSITSSARASSLSGIWRPSALAVLRFMTNSNLVACCTGMSIGFAPL